MPNKPAPDFSRGAPAARNELFRFVFSRAENARGELAALLPAEIAAKLELDSLCWLQDHAAPGAFGCELLFSLRLSAREGYALLLLEPDGAAELGAPLRLLAAVLRIWLARAPEHTARPLPLVIPLLVRQGPRRWRGPSSLGDLFEVDLASWVALAPLIPDFALLLDDLAGVGAAALRTRRQLPALGQLALFLLQRAGRAPDLVLELAEWLEPIAALLRSGGADDFAALLDYAFWVADVSLERLRALLAERAAAPAEEIMVTTAERLIARGRAEGERQGRALTLLTFLGQRFGELSAADRQRVLAASSAELQHWAERLPSSLTAEQLFA
jgi:hypothetical protein